MPNRPARAFLRSFRSDGMPSQRGPRFPRRLKDRPDCSACRDGTPSPSRLRACRAIARYLDWRSETDMTDGNRPQSLRPNTKILRLRTDHARQHAPTEDRQRLPSFPGSDLFPLSSESMSAFVSPRDMQIARRPRSGPCFQIRDSISLSLASEWASYRGTEAMQRPDF